MARSSSQTTAARAVRNPRHHRPDGAPHVRQSLAERSLGAARLLTEAYDRVFGTISECGLRLGAHDALLQDASLSIGGSTEQDPPSAARVPNSGFEQGREDNLRRRLRRIQDWTVATPTFARRRNSVCQRLIAARSQVLREMVLDRNWIDQFINEVLADAQALRDASRRARQEHRPLIEQRYCCSLPELRAASMELNQARRQIRRQRSVLVRANAGLVASVAQRYVGRGVPLEDLIQEGQLGILRAIDKFDPARGFQFSTYAMWWVRQSMTRAICDQSRTVRVPVHMNDWASRVRRAEWRLTGQLGREPDAKELAALLGSTEQHVAGAKQRLRTEVSLQRALNSDGSGELGDHLVDDNAEDGATRVHRKSLAVHAERALADLDERSRFVLQARHGIGGESPQTLAEISRTLGLSRERVRQIEQEALARLRRLARDNHLAEFL